MILKNILAVQFVPFRLVNAKRIICTVKLNVDTVRDLEDFPNRAGKGEIILIQITFYTEV